VARVRVNYADGTPPVTQEHVDGVIAVATDARRRPRSLDAYDAGGRRITTVALSHSP
jgi:hypothetical protein